ncbi:MAG: hypothetical protein ACE5K0_04180, partial [Candidatus Methanofastidiosia archaeon]
MTSTEFQITTDPSHQSNPAIYGDIVVWQDNRNSDFDIFGYNLSTKQIFQITSNENYQGNPAIYGNIVVWEDLRNENWDIYGYDLSKIPKTSFLSQTTTTPVETPTKPPSLFSPYSYGILIMIAILTVILLIWREGKGEYIIDKKRVVIISSLVLSFIFILVIFNPFPPTYKLYCEKNYEDDTFEIFFMNPDGTSSGTLFIGDDEGIHPSLLWTPEGPKFMYNIYEKPEEDQYIFWKTMYPELYVEENQIWLMNFDGSEKKSFIEDYWLKNISKDGEKLLLTKKDDGDIELWIMNWDGTGLMQLTDNDVVDEFPQFALDDEKIVYFSGQKIIDPLEIEGTSEIWIMNIDGSEKKRISMESKNSGPGIISPDGEKMVYYEEIDESLEGIYVIKLDGSEKTLIEEFENPLTFYRWSPSGDYIVYSLQYDI